MKEAKCKAYETISKGDEKVLCTVVCMSMICERAVIVEFLTFYDRPWSYKLLKKSKIINNCFRGKQWDNS